LLKEIVWPKHSFVIDCGANVGDFHFALSSLGIDHTYMGFEPSPTEYGCLSQNVPEGSSHNVGLWEGNSELDFYVSMNNADSSFIKPESYTEIKKIATKRLDSMDLGNGKITLLKLEAEGAELEVLKGCTGILDRIQYISADLGFERGGESPLPEVTNFLNDHSFEMIKFGYPRIVALYENKTFSSG
jgi:FkbM family methyltransferase